MKRLIQVLVFVLVAALTGCTGIDVVPTPMPGPSPTFKPVVIKGNKVAIATVKKFLYDYEIATADDTLTVGETVDVVFDSGETALKVGEVWDKVITKDARTVGDIYQICRLTLEAGLRTGGLWNYTLFTPDTPHAQFGNALARMVATTVIDILGQEQVTVSDIVAFPVKVTRFVLTELKIWDKVITKRGTTVGEAFELGETTLQLTLITFRVENLVLIIIEEPATVTPDDLDGDGVENTVDGCLFVPGDVCPEEASLPRAVVGF